MYAAVATLGLALVSAVIGSIVWVVQLNGRLETHVARNDERYSYLTTHLLTITDWLGRIEAKLDRLCEREGPGAR